MGVYKISLNTDFEVGQLVKFKNEDQEDQLAIIERYTYDYYDQGDLSLFCEVRYIDSVYKVKRNCREDGCQKFEKVFFDTEEICENKCPNKEICKQCCEYHDEYGDEHCGDCKKCESCTRCKDCSAMKDFAKKCVLEEQEKMKQKIKEVDYNVNESRFYYDGQCRIDRETGDCYYLDIKFIDKVYKSGRATRCWIKEKYLEAVEDWEIEWSEY